MFNFERALYQPEILRVQARKTTGHVCDCRPPQGVIFELMRRFSYTDNELAPCAGTNDDWAAPPVIEQADTRDRTQQLAKRDKYIIKNRIVPSVAAAALGLRASADVMRSRGIHQSRLNELKACQQYLQNGQISIFPAVYAMRLPPKARCTTNVRDTALRRHQPMPRNRETMHTHKYAPLLVESPSLI